MSRPDLYRQGNTTSPRYDNVRPQDIPVVGGQVRPGTGGISTFTAIGADWDRRRTWVLQQSQISGLQLATRNDRGNHWLIEPSQTMTLTNYVAQLTTLNGRARLVPPALADASIPTARYELVEQSAHTSKATRFVFNALATVVRQSIPVTTIADWDENDTYYLVNLAKSLDDGSADLSEFTWTEGCDLTKERVFVAAAVSAYIKQEEVRVKALRSEDADSDAQNDHALLYTALGLDIEENPLVKTYRK